MKNRKWLQTCTAGLLSAAMLTTSVSVWGAEFSDGTAAQDTAAAVMEVDAAEEEVLVLDDAELFSADDGEAVLDARASEVSISSTYFPDAKFRAYVADSFDTNNNGKLSTDEIKAATTVNVSDLGISNLKGIEKLPYATALFAARNKLKTVNLTGNTRLKNINLDKNALTGTLDLSKCTKMEIIKYSNNQLSKVLMPSYKYMGSVDFIDASHNKFKSQTDAGLKYINNKYMPELSEVNASYNAIPSFNCAGFKGILDLRVNKITSLYGGTDGYQAVAIYLDGKYNTLSKTPAVDFSAAGNRIPQRISFNSNLKSKFKMVTPSLRVVPTWDKITVTVGSTADEASYVLQRSENGGSYKTIATWAAGELDNPEFGENQYVDTNVSTGKKYTYKLTASVNVQDMNKVERAWPETISKTEYAAETVTGMTLQSSKKGYAKVTWDKVPGAYGYQVYFGPSASKATISLTKGTTRNYAIKTGMRSGRTYYFRVRAFKKVNGQNVYGPFCTPKPLKIK